MLCRPICSAVKDVVVKHSDVPGVRWCARTGKWIGCISNPLKRTASGGRKQETTSYFVNEAECIEATNALRQRVHDEYWAHCTALAATDPLMIGLPCGPKDAAEAEKQTVYWRPNQNDKHKPYRIVRMNAGKQGAMWIASCQHGVGVECCNQIAVQAFKGGPKEFCTTHGGHCPHGSTWKRCRECNPNATKMMSNCSLCAMQLSAKRMESNGGTGYCYTCEQRAKNEAAENGSAPPPKGKRWEHLVLDELVTLVVDTDGRPILYESRDDLKYMLGSRNKRRKDECSTAHQRRPDLLYLVRDTDSHIVAALLVEVDENSHSDRNPQCEAGKIDETFQCLHKLAQEEGKSHLAETRAGEIHTPFVCFFKFNPNACDAPGGVIKLSTRIQILADRCNAFLNTDPAVFHARSDAGESMLPHVQCLYYHTKQGAKNLAYFDEHAPSAWKWSGNACPRS